LAEHGAYTVLLDTYYGQERPLPAEYPALFRICRAMTTDEQDAVRRVADSFFPIKDDGLRHNKRADVDIDKANKRIQSARENGKMGGRKKQYRTDKEPSGLPSGQPSENPSETQRAAQQGTQTPTGIKAHQAPCTMYSDSKESGAAPPPPDPPDIPEDIPPEPPEDYDPVKELFDLGVAILTKVDVPKDQARSLIGKLRSIKTDAEAMAVIVEARDKTDPKAYIARVMNPKPDKHGYVSGKGHTRVAL